MRNLFVEPSMDSTALRLFMAADIAASMCSSELKLFM